MNCGYIICCQCEAGPHLAAVNAHCADCGHQICDFCTVEAFSRLPCDTIPVARQSPVTKHFAQKSCSSSSRGTQSTKQSGIQNVTREHLKPDRIHESFTYLAKHSNKHGDPQSTRAAHRAKYQSPQSSIPDATRPHGETFSGDRNQHRESIRAVATADCIVAGDESASDGTLKIQPLSKPETRLDHANDNLSSPRLSSKTPSTQSKRPRKRNPRNTPRDTQCGYLKCPYFMKDPHKYRKCEKGNWDEVTRFKYVCIALYGGTG